jgi:hypothetical protein
MAGLLTYSLLLPPSHPTITGAVALRQKQWLELTAAGTVPEFHGIPSSSAGDVG